MGTCEKIIYRVHFNPRSLTGATTSTTGIIPALHHFNPRSLTGATDDKIKVMYTIGISIHAPSRERPLRRYERHIYYIFQSTLPHGSDHQAKLFWKFCKEISIHAPSRERPLLENTSVCITDTISIHAPSRERPSRISQALFYQQFQSTLPHGSDRGRTRTYKYVYHFNPRSLTGATPVGKDFCINHGYNFNPRSLTGATTGQNSLK